MFVTAEFVFLNRELNKINNIIKNTQLECNQKYGYNCYAKIDVKCSVKFFDKIENKTKNIMIEHENIIGKVNKILQSSKGIIKFISALELIIRIQGKICKNVVNAYAICDNVPIIWKKHYVKIRHDRYGKHNQLCRENHFHNFANFNGCYLIMCFSFL